MVRSFHGSGRKARQNNQTANLFSNRCDQFHFSARVAVGPLDPAHAGQHMTVLTRAKLSNVFVFALLGIVAIASTAAAAQRTNKPSPQVTVIGAATAATSGAGEAGSGGDIVVVRDGAPTIAFTDDAAIYQGLASTRAKIKTFEAALAKDLAHRDFRARQTRQAIRTAKHETARSTADELVAARRELSELKLALGQDIANGDFYAPHTREELARPHGSTLDTGEDALAYGAVSLSDEMWSLEMAFEKDLHAHNLRAVETHFVIDGRRWKV